MAIFTPKFNELISTMKNQIYHRQRTAIFIFQLCA